MTYRISYDDGLVATTDAQDHEGVTRTEYFRTEYEALKRARQLLEDGDHHAVSLCDSSGSVLAGIRLQLRLGRRSRTRQLISSHLNKNQPTQKHRAPYVRTRPTRL